jgi:phosphate-selective porin OprO/OprP
MATVAIPVAAAFAVEVAVGEGGSVEFRAGEQSLRLGGRVRIDAGFFDDETTDFPGGIRNNQTLLLLQGRRSDAWSLALGYEFIGEQFLNLFVERSGLPIGDLRIGQFRPQVGLFPGGTWITFNHRSTVEQALALPRLVGVGLNGAAGRLTYSASASGDQIDGDSEGDAPFRGAARLAMRIGRDPEAPMQVGLTLVERQTDATRKVSFSANLGIQLDGTPKLLRATQSATDHYRLAVLEGLWMDGPLSLQGEYMRAALDAPGSPVVDGFYAQVVYFLTGDTRHYAIDNATIGRPILKDAVRGAWEVGLRFERLDLQPVGGGRADNVAVAINHYFSNPLRLTTTLTHASIDDGVNGDERVFSCHLRLQWFL